MVSMHRRQHSSATTPTASSINVAPSPPLLSMPFSPPRDRPSARLCHGIGTAAMSAIASGPMVPASPPGWSRTAKLLIGRNTAKVPTPCCRRRPRRQGLASGQERLKRPGIGVPSIALTTNSHRRSLPCSLHRPVPATSRATSTPVVSTSITCLAKSITIAPSYRPARESGGSAATKRLWPPVGAKQSVKPQGQVLPCFYTALARPVGTVSASAGARKCEHAAASRSLTSDWRYRAAPGTRAISVPHVAPAATLSTRQPDGIASALRADRG